MIKIKFDKENNKSLAYDNEKLVGECEFIELDNTWNIIHTVVSQSYQGQGIARKLVEIIIDEAKRNSKNIIAECSYAIKLIENNN